MKQYIFFLGIIVLLLAGISCSHDDPVSIIDQPIVRITNGKAEANRLIFTVTPQRASECAYAYYKKGETPLKTEEVFSLGKTIDATVAATITLDAMEWGTTYVILSVVKNEKGETGSSVIELTTDTESGPTVRVLNASSEDNTITFTISPKGAAACAYLYYKKGEETPSMDKVLSSGIAVDVSSETTVTVKDLKSLSTYVVMAVVKNQSGLYNLSTVKLETGKALYGTDLGAGANCYIVSQAGKYNFKPLKVSGAKIEGIVKADWLWTTKTDGTDAQQLVANVCYDNGRINFDATGKRGNAVIAAFDAAGKIVWVWLIWCTDMPEVMEYEGGARFMDRLMGATGANPDDGKATWGVVLWQWGRNVPLFGGYEDTEPSHAQVFNEARKWTILNPAYPSEWKNVNHGVSVEGSLAEPTSFFYVNNTSDWHETVDLTLWGDKKTDYDPCPAGYQLPNSAQFETWKNKVVISSDPKGIRYTWNGKTAWWPSCGSGRNGRTGDWGCLTINENAGNIFVWTSTSKILTDPMMGYFNYPTVYRFMVQTAASNIWIGISNRSMAHSVRCVAEN